MTLELLKTNIVGKYGAELGSMLGVKPFMMDGKYTFLLIRGGADNKLYAETRKLNEDTGDLELVNSIALQYTISQTFTIIRCRSTYVGYSPESIEVHVVESEYSSQDYGYETLMIDKTTGSITRINPTTGTFGVPLGETRIGLDALGYPVIPHASDRVLWYGYSNTQKELPSFYSAQIYMWSDSIVADIYREDGAYLGSQFRPVSNTDGANAKIGAYVEDTDADYAIEETSRTMSVFDMWRKGGTTRYIWLLRNPSASAWELRLYSRLFDQLLKTYTLSIPAEAIADIYPYSYDDDENFKLLVFTVKPALVQKWKIEAGTPSLIQSLDLGDATYGWINNSRSMLIFKKSEGTIFLLCPYETQYNSMSNGIAVVKEENTDYEDDIESLMSHVATREKTTLTLTVAPL